MYQMASTNKFDGCLKLFFRRQLNVFSMLSVGTFKRLNTLKQQFFIVVGTPTIRWSILR